jgi:cyclopropane fatty-acyl-phospholipid synthase-like methyltransferase
VTTAPQVAPRALRGSGARKSSLLDRLKQWFGRGFGSAPAAAGRRPRAGSEEATAGEDRPAIAPLSRMTVAQWLWGEGFVMPGGAEYVLELVKPFGLTPAMSMLDLSAGLGGPARVIAHAFGTYITGLERSPERAKRGMEMSTAANLAKRATIVHYDPESVELRPNSFDCVLGRGATSSVADKERFLRVIHQGMKQRGQLLLNEFTVNSAAAKHPALASWAARESFTPSLWTIEQYTDCLNSLGFDIRVVEDVSGVYRAMIVAGWARMLKEVDLKGMEKVHRITVIDEAELWMRRIAALESNALKVFRVYALLNKQGR